MEKTIVICRCEEISYEEIEEVIEHGARSHDDIKRLTRCGMGPCQGKICFSLVASIIHKKTKIPFSTIPLPRMRMPISPIKIETLSTGNSTFSTVKSVLDEVELNVEKGR
ncbi:MAG TPA: (2Fe-2S)-binding protein [Bacillus sp. (in: firmicutes)]|nr:(2Fe-2S)-binding protein [Bacillus sp. (in: firmicutes)]